MSHETYHSWYARGVRPLTQSDGWIDEAWTTYAVDQDNNDVSNEPIGKMMEWPRGVSPDEPWNRLTLIDSYFVGAFVFRWIAASIGHEAMVGAMADFYQLHAPGPITTAGLERHLHCQTKDPSVREVFHTLVYGRTDSLEPVPDGYCD